MDLQPKDLFKRWARPRNRTCRMMLLHLKTKRACAPSTLCFWSGTQTSCNCHCVLRLKGPLYCYYYYYHHYHYHKELYFGVRSPFDHDCRCRIFRSLANRTLELHLETNDGSRDSRAPLEGTNPRRKMPTRMWFSMVSWENLWFSTNICASQMLCFLRNSALGLGLSP